MTVICRTKQLGIMETLENTQATIKIDLTPTKRVVLSHEANLDLEDGKAWVTFIDDGWEDVWHPIMIGNVHIDFKNHDSKLAMAICREAWGGITNFGIAPTSQMLIGNAVRDNF